MRLRSLALLAMLLVPAAPAFAGEPSVRYQVAVESPGGVARGTVPIRVRVSGGVRDAREAAVHLRTSGGWRDDERIGLTRVSDSVFETSWDTRLWQNASYQIEVRVWGDVPPYDPSDERTFARAVGEVAVDNAPPTPERIQALSPASAIRIAWTPVPTADRGDFDGYRVLAHRGARCPADPEAYRPVADVWQSLYTDLRPAEGRYCFRVAASRYSAVTGSIRSAPSPPVRIRVDRDAGGAVGVVPGGAPAPPPPPVLGEGTVEVSDGAFAEDLPYGPETVTEVVEGRSDAAAPEREPGADPRRTPTLVALGLLLAVGALLIRRFLGVGPLPG